MAESSKSLAPRFAANLRLPGTYQLDQAVLLQKAYYLLCFVFANKEIARRSNPDNPQEPLSSLESKFFEVEVSRALIELAIGLRVIDDQMKRKGQDEKSKRYKSRLRIVNGYDYSLFGENLTLRKICNRIIHSEVMEFNFTEGVEPHELDPAIYGMIPKSIDWTHVSGFVRLSGKERKKEWHELLDTEQFIKGIYYLFQPDS